MPSAMSHLNRGLHLRAYDSLNKYLCSIMPLELHISLARCNKLLCLFWVRYHRAITGFVRGITKSYKVLYLFLKNKTSYKVLYFIEGLTFFGKVLFLCLILDVLYQFCQSLYI